MLYEPSFGQEVHTIAIRAAIERHRQLELRGVDADSSTGDRHAFCIARELEFRSGRPEILERQVAVAQDVDFSVLDPPMHPASHLKNLVGSQVCPCQHVLATLHHIRVAGIVDHDRIEPANIQRRLARSRHGEEEGSFDQTVKKRPDDPNRLAAVIKGGRQIGPAVAKLFRDLLDLRTSWDEDRYATPLAHDALYETIVQELEGLLRQDIDLSRLGWIERPGLQSLGGSQIVRIETRIHCRGQPDEAATRPLAECQAQLHLGGGLVDFVDDEGVLCRDEAILEPAACDSGGNDDDVPGWGLGCRLALAIDDAHLQRRPENSLRHASDCERLASARASHDAKTLAGR